MTTTYNTRIGLISDIHSDYENHSLLEEELINAVQAIENEKADHLILLGDMIEGEISDTDTVSQLHDIIDIITETTDIPATIVRGNHDVLTSNENEADIPTDKMGTIEFANNITGIYLDTSSPEYPDARGKLGEEQLQYLDETLATVEKAVIFSHHPLYYHDLSEDGHFAEHPEAAFCHDKYRAQMLFKDHENVIALVNGHTHISNHTIYKDIPCFTVNAFNKERPDDESINGSFELLDISRSQVKRIKHIHGEFDGTDVVDYPLGDETVALGGTFGPIHDGHRQMFRRAFEIGDVLIGVTSDTLATQTRHEPRPIPSYQKRIDALNPELEQLSNTYDRSYNILKLTDPFGGVTDNADITHLIVSPETFSRGEEVNEKRIANGLEPVEIEIVEPLLADDGQRISSTRIVNEEIDEHGNVLS